MLQQARCIECGQVKSCIGFEWHSGKTGESGVNYYCPECDEMIEDWLDSELEKLRSLDRKVRLAGSWRNRMMNTSSN